MAQKKAEEFVDFYEVLEVAPDATDEVVRAYRRRALRCHPDKNPDNPRAAEEFLRLTRALGVLSDAAARAAFDKVLKSRKAAELRRNRLHGERKRLREDLEARERAAATVATPESRAAQEAEAEATLQAEIERLRKEGSRLVEREERLLREEMERAATEAAGDRQEQKVHPRLKVKWKCRKGTADDSGGYTRELLEATFARYGPVAAVVLSAKKPGSALVEMESVEAAGRAVLEERGLAVNPLKVAWVTPPPPAAAEQESTPGASNSMGGSSFAGVPQQETVVPPREERDFESLVLMKMRQAEERKRLIAEMEAEDAAVPKQQTSNGT